ncbi:hypothetical protein BGZ76_009045 [Entomortierella beljakovae]|nr:hypothetical protein BGZ76_009045 [Entomortierella beljakovae]
MEYAQSANPRVNRCGLLRIWYAIHFRSMSPQEDDLPPRIQPLFRSLESICHDTMDAWKICLDFGQLQFHEDNLQGLVEHLRNKTSRQHQILVKARSELMKMKDMKRELQELKLENEQLKKKLDGKRDETRHIDRAESLLGQTTALPPIKQTATTKERMSEMLQPFETHGHIMNIEQKKESSSR